MIKSRMGADLDQTVRRIFPFVARLRIHPDVLTLVGAFVSGIAAVALAANHLFAGGLLLMVAGFFDLVDGVVARQQGLSSTAGAFFDSSIDRLSDLLVFGGLIAGAAGRGDVAGAVLGLWALSGSIMTSYTRASAEKRLNKLAVGFVERGERFGILILGALTGWIQLALFLVAIGSTITAIQRILEGRRLLRILEETGVDPTADDSDTTEESKTRESTEEISK
ncbi:MAG: CDP-alcohol phosphatidyltransferase family protein [bacterium]|nr:CDP-alcohol phosphatidyltransferase family protein [bacterium]